MEAERKQVTVLFADMVGFTSFSERSGEEAAFTLIRSLSKLMDEAVREQGGFVRGFTGDGIMAVFGAPVAFEDAPLRACRAALNILQRLKAAGLELEAKHGATRTAVRQNAAAASPVGNHDTQKDAAPSPSSRSRNRAGRGTAVEVSSGGAYAVQLTSERSAAEAHASFRTLRAKFPNQLGGREPMVRRTDLGAKGIYYRTMVGPFASMEKAAGMCRTLKTAGCNCLVQRNWEAR